MPRLAWMTPIERLSAVANLDSEQQRSVLPMLRPSRVSLPNRRLRALGDSPTGRRWESMLVALETFDHVLEDLVGYKAHIYVLGDEGVLRLINLLRSERQAPLRGVSPDLDVLAACGLIYRFNVALKFGYPPRSVMQVRLNGWGRHLVEQDRLSEHARYATYRDVLRDKLRAATEHYREQIQLCAGDVRPLPVDKIHVLNEKLPIQVVT